MTKLNGWKLFSMVMVLLLVAVFPLSDLMPPQYRSADTPTLPAKESILEAYGRLPILFIQNQGQLDEAVEYYVRTSAQTLYFTEESIVFDLTRYNDAEANGRADRRGERLVFSLDFLGANNKPTIEGSGKDSAVVNYLIGNDPEKWHTDISTYRELAYKDIYPNIDLKLYGKEGCLEYEFVVRPGATPDDISLAYHGINSLTVEDGELVVGTAFGDIKQGRPYIYQQIGNEMVQVDGGFRLADDNSYGFYVAAYDVGYPLVIDPALSLDYSTYLGGNGTDNGFGIAVESGCAYVTGKTDSTDFPTLNQYQGTNAGSYDAFVAKLDTAQSGAASLIYSTYLGGSLGDYGFGIAIESGCAYVTGKTDSTDFPISNQYQTDGTGTDAFVTKLNTSGNGLIYSSYLGGNGTDGGDGIAVESGCAYVTGYTYSTDFPTLNPYQTNQPGYDAFIAKIDTAQSGPASLVYSTYLGGGGDDYGYGIAVESECAYVTGDTSSTDFPTLNPYQTNQPDNDAFIAKIDTAQSGPASLVYSTYLGGNSNEDGYGIAVESGCAYVTGDTYSTDFPTVNQYQTNQPDNDAFIAKIDTALSGTASLVYSTYLGGNGTDVGYGIAVDSGCAYVTGDTSSTDFPTLNPYQTDQTGKDGFVTKLKTSGNGLIYSTYLGGSSDEYGDGIAVESGCAYVTGITTSTDFPILNGYQTDQASCDAFVARLGATIPWVVADYSIKGSIKFFDWKCNKWIVLQSGTLHITEQAEHKIKGYFEPGVTIEGWPSPVPVEGYVGPFERDAKGKVKNKPRLSLVAKLGTYCEYPDETYVTYILNGAIKWDKKTNTVKSIKCTINGWGELSTAFDDGSPSVGQFEGKFTATPIP